MTRSIEADYSQTFLLPHSLEDWVEADHPVRFIRDFVESLDLEALGFVEPSAKAGRGNPHYSCDLLLKIWLYGWLEKIRTTRPLERACRQHLALMWLAGLHAPDHNTLWRFWKANLAAMSKLFKRSVEVAVDAGLVSMVLHAVDGTKMQAAGGGCAKQLDRGKLEKLLAATDKAIEQMNTALEAEGKTSDDGEYRLPQELVDARARRETIQRSLKKLSDHECETMLENEPDAKRVRGTKGVMWGVQRSSSGGLQMRHCGGRTCYQ